MSNVFTYPNNADTNYINPADPILLGSLKRANTFLNGGNNENVPYAKPYWNATTRFQNLSPRTPENLLSTVSRYRSFYGVASFAGKNGYPTYQAVYNEPLVEAYFHQIQFRITGATSTNPLTLDCRRDATSHPNALSFTATDTHGMGNATTKYTDTYPRQFNLTGFDTAVAGQWGNVLNGNDFYLKVVDAQTVEVYEDENHTIPVDASGWSAYTSGGLCKINLQTVEEVTTTTTFNPTTVEKGIGRKSRGVAISIDYIAVAAIDENSTIDNRGHVYVFNKSTGAQIWNLEHPENRADAFGRSLAIAGNYLVVGSCDDDLILGEGPDTGKAYVFNLSTGALLWTFTGPSQSEFGIDVAAEGTQCIVGARRATGGGKAYVYDMTTGNLVRTIDNPDPISAGTNDFFGDTVAINGSYYIVGAPSEDQTAGLAENTGKVYLFSRSTGTLQHTLDKANTRGFGRYLSIDGNNLLVGEGQYFNYYDLSTLPTITVTQNIGGLDVDTIKSLDVDGIYAVKDNEIYDLTTGTLVRNLPVTATSVGIHADSVVLASDADDRAYVYQRSTGNFLFELVPQQRSKTTTTTVVEGQPYTYQLLNTYFIDASNRTYLYYDKDYYSGAGNSVNDDFGAFRNGAKPQFYVFKDQTNSTFFQSQTPIDWQSYANWWYDSNFNPAVTVTVNNDGGVVGPAYVNGTSINPEFGGLMALGGTDAAPFQYGALTAIKVQPKDSDALAGFNFAISNITQASPAVITFVNSVKDQSADGNANASKTINGVVGMTEINGRLIYLKQTSHNTAEVYTNAACTTPLDTTGFTAYTSGGNLQDYDNNEFAPINVFGANFYGRSLSGSYQNFAPLAVDYGRFESIDQIWPQTVSPAKADITLVQPTRKTYAQDLTRYTNSIAAYGYRLEVTYNNISKTAWKDYDAFIKQMRGASAPFVFRFRNNLDGGGYQPFETNLETLSKWQSSPVRLAKQINPGDTQVYFIGFDPNDPAICRPNDVFFGIHTYSELFTTNNVAFAGGTFGSNEFGEAIIRFTHPIKNTGLQLSTGRVPAQWDYAFCQLSDDEVEYNWHPTGKFVSFTVSMDLI